jgi:hypothetical protein
MLNRTKLPITLCTLQIAAHAWHALADHIRDQLGHLCYSKAAFKEKQQPSRWPSMAHLQKSEA